MVLHYRFLLWFGGPICLRVFIPCGTVAPNSQALEAFSRANPGIQISPVVDKGKALARRLQKGEKCDVFIGRPEEMQPLVKEGFLKAASHAPIAAHILSLIVPADNPARLRSLQDLASARLHKLAIAPSNSHPGKYTRQALQRLRLAGKIGVEKIVSKSADELPALVGKGEAEAALLFRSCVQQGIDEKGGPVVPRRLRIIADLPASSHDEILLSAAVASPSLHKPQARRLVDFLAGPGARRFFLRSGFRASCDSPH